MSDYEKYCDFGSGAYYKFLEQNPEFENKDFEEFVICHNKADRDSGELGDIRKDEVERLAKEWSSSKASNLVEDLNSLQS
jgi:hypothetical protein